MNFDMLLRRALPTLAVGAAITLLAGCSRSVAQQQPPPTAVTVAPVEQQDIVEWDEFTGHTEPVQSVEVRPYVSGYIQEVRFQSGQLVKKGDVLFTIDPRWFKADYDRLEAESERSKVLLENARREADRTKQLLENKAISTEEADARVSRYEAAKAGTSRNSTSITPTSARPLTDGSAGRC
jgi:RND family efflux transporter MFP subunit